MKDTVAGGKVIPSLLKQRLSVKCPCVPRMDNTSHTGQYFSCLQLSLVGNCTENISIVSIMQKEVVCQCLGLIQFCSLFFSLVNLTHMNLTQ